MSGTLTVRGVVGGKRQGAAMMRDAVTLYLTGPSGVGKTEVAEILADQHGYAVLSLGDQCRQAAQRRGLPTDRVTLQRMGDELRRGDDAALARRAWRAALQRPGPVVIEGVRLRAEGEYLAAQGVVGVRVEAPEAARSARLLVRDGSAQVPPHRTENEVPPYAQVIHNDGDRDALVRAVRRMVGRATLEYAAARQGRDLGEAQDSAMAAPAPSAPREEYRRHGLQH